MKPWRARGAGAALMLAGASLATFTWPMLRPAWGQQQTPESLLPPGFGAPVAPAPQVAPPAAPASSGTEPPVQATNILPPTATPAPPADATGEDLLGNEGVAEDPAAAEDLELPVTARRSTETVGPLLPQAGGLGYDAWGDANGVFLASLMRRIDAPVASRWASILLRRALISQASAPAASNPVDWVAERAWLLLRMGEADAARMLVQSVDVIRYTPRMISVAQQVALATADPAALCPLADKAVTLSREPSWPLAQAICAAFSGDQGVAGALIDRARQAKIARGVDLLLAEKAVGAGSNGRRAVNIEWNRVDQLTSWRFGLASALNVPIPDRLFDSVGPQVRAWEARAPMLTAEQRLVPARTAAVLGVFSNQSLADLYDVLAEAGDATDADQSPAARFRAAYLGDDADARMTALRALWDVGDDPYDRYASSILTARAAAAIRPADDLSGDAAPLIGSMLSAGFDRQAERWAATVGAIDGSRGDDPWALLALGGPRGLVDLTPARVSTYLDRAGLEHRHRAQLLVAGLAGLGRLSSSEAPALAAGIGLDLAARNRWSQAIERAADDRQPGTVALLAAVGLQTRDWRAVPAANLYRIVSALRRVGLEPEARMIAAEAVARA